MGLAESLRTASNFENCIALLPLVDREITSGDMQMVWRSLILRTALLLHAKTRKECEEVRALAEQHNFLEIVKIAINQSRIFGINTHL